MPHNRPTDYVGKKIRLCERNKSIIFLCAQSLELSREEDRLKIFDWMDRLLQLK